MTILSELRKSNSIFIACPNCDEEFPAQDAALFDATAKLSAPAREKLSEMREALREERVQHRAAIEKLKARTNIAARVTNVGKTVEKIAPSLAGFPESPAECRALYEPIDYLAFRGLSRGVIDSVAFVDLKSGRARLSTRQREIRTLIEAGTVSFHISSEGRVAT